MKKILLPLFLLYVHIGTLQAQSLSQRLDSLLLDPQLTTSEVGIAVYDLTDGKTLYQHQAEKLYRPASTLKIITTITALSMLGTDYTMNTRLQHTGTIENDTLKGNLYLIGGMDPEFMEADLDSLVEAMAQSGIRHIRDTLAADVSMTDSVHWGPGWSWDDEPYAFQPDLSPLLLNRGCVDITVAPVEKGQAPLVSVTPVSDDYQVENQAVSRNPEAGKLKITRSRTGEGNRIIVTGNAERLTTGTLSVRSSKDFFLRTFIDRLNKKGITFGQTTFADSPLQSDTIYIRYRPIGEVMKQALKESDNLCAESLFFHLAQKQSEHPRVKFEDGQETIQTWMKDTLGQNPENYRIADGSGLSVYNYVSPQLLLEYLKWIYKHPNLFSSFYESLPIAGIDGTLEHRMKKTAAYRKVRAKTGSVTGVSSLAGYAQASDGHLLAFVIINQNVMKLRQARTFQDKICNTLCR